MEITKAGPDEIRFPSHRRREAEIVAAFLPTLREKARELLAWQDRRPVRVVLAERPPGIGQACRVNVKGLAMWLVQFLALLIFAWALYGAAIGAVLGGLGALVVVGSYSRPYLATRKAWPFIGGMAVYSPHWAEPIVFVNIGSWPTSPELEQLILELGPEDWLRSVVAHEYAHIAMRARYRTASVPAWLGEGVGYWFAEEIAGAQYWGPESRSCLEEPEPRRDPWWRIADGAKQRAARYRLAARYYWEVQHLARAGRIGELLATPLKKTGSLRPSPEQVRAGWQ
jgi:hypothetical protein